MSNHVERMEEEYKELVGRMTRLGMFIRDNPLYHELPIGEQEDMVDQHSAMLNYATHLCSRILRAKPKG